MTDSSASATVRIEPIQPQPAPPITRHPIAGDHSSVAKGRLPVMPRTLLAEHRQHLPVGEPLPFDVFDADGRLLLARGQRVQSHAQLDSLIRRDAWVDLAPTDSVPDAHARAAGRVRAWEDAVARTRGVLAGPVALGFDQMLDGAAQPLVALVERDPDLAIFGMVRPDADSGADYASSHAIHAALAAYLAAQRLNWSPCDRWRAFRAALTMNLSMVTLQNQLAAQADPVTPTQRIEIRSHPDRSADLLADAGITDADWLRAVRDHHEYGAARGGYPRGVDGVGELALLVQRADVFTAKFAGRRNRHAMASDQAARTQFARDRDSPVSAALIKEFGLYPPGTGVRLMSGEVGLVIQRGPTAATPVVAVVADGCGRQVPRPTLRDTGAAAHAVAQTLPTHELPLRLPLASLLVLAD